MSHPWIAPLKPNAIRARRVRETARFFLREALQRRRAATYELRDHPGVRVVLRHGTPDIEAFDEIFVQRIYAEPDTIRSALAGLDGPPRVADLGANIGLFAAWTHATHPEARTVCLEPDPHNLAQLRRANASNGGRWQIEPVAAAASQKELPFVAGQFAMSRAPQAGEEATTVVPARDAFDYMGPADLIKIDIEGGEWELLLDPRMRSLAARAIALEYHPAGCPEPGDACACARRLLTDAGYAVADVPTQAPPGHGSLWAWR